MRLTLSHPSFQMGNEACKTRRLPTCLNVHSFDDWIYLDAVKHLLPSPLSSPKISSVLRLYFCSITSGAFVFHHQACLKRRVGMFDFKIRMHLVSVALLARWYFLIAPPLCEASGSQCFSLDGTITTDQPCDPTQSESFCCGIGWACLENKICAPTPNVPNYLSAPPARGSCTDSSWSASQCPNFCVDGDSTYPTGSTLLRSTLGG